MDSYLLFQAWTSEGVVKSFESNRWYWMAHLNLKANWYVVIYQSNVSFPPLNRGHKLYLDGTFFTPLNPSTSTYQG